MKGDENSREAIISNIFIKGGAIIRGRRLIGERLLFEETRFVTTERTYRYRSHVPFSFLFCFLSEMVMALIYRVGDRISD